MPRGETTGRVLKRCPRCGDPLPIGAFGLDKSRSDGRAAVCLMCIRRRRAQTRAQNRAFVDEINARTACAHCGGQPVEWHNPEHVALHRESYRIGAMIDNQSTTAAIQEEMDRSTPLCRRCHMIEDGRMATFMAQANAPKNQPPKPCIDCGQPSKPLRKGRCHRCNERRRYHAKRGLSCQGGDHTSCGMGCHGGDDDA